MLANSKATAISRSDRVGKVRTLAHSGQTAVSRPRADIDYPNGIVIDQRHADSVHRPASGWEKVDRLRDSVSLQRGAVCKKQDLSPSRSPPLVFLYFSLRKGLKKAARSYLLFRCRVGNPSKTSLCHTEFIPVKVLFSRLTF